MLPQQVGDGQTADHRQNSCYWKRKWCLRRLVSGRGILAAQRFKNSSGSNASSRVPSCHVRFSLMAPRRLAATLSFPQSGRTTTSFRLSVAMRPSASECTRDGTREPTRDPRKISATRNYLEGMVGRDGIEPPTPGFSVLVLDHRYHQHLHCLMCRRRIVDVPASS